MDSPDIKGTCVLQPLLEVAKAKTQSWVEIVYPTLEEPNIDLDYVIKMDRTYIYWCPMAPTTISCQGPCTVCIHYLCGRSKRATGFFAVTASVVKLVLFIIFQGKPGSTIAKQFDSVIAGAEYAVQEKA
jgi:hypothetical protein